MKEKRKRYFSLEERNKMIKEANKRIKIDLAKENVYLKDLLMQQTEVLNKIKEYMKNRVEEYNNSNNQSRDCINAWHYRKLIKDIIKLLEEIE